MARRKKLVTRPPTFAPGQRIRAFHGGGGPENLGAKNTLQAAVIFHDSQPPWATEAETFGEYIGYAAPSVKPNLSGIPANNFRSLGDNFGGRQ